MGNLPKALGPDWKRYRLYVRGHTVMATPWPRVGLWKYQGEEWVELLPSLKLERSGLMEGYPPETAELRPKYRQIDEKECQRNFSAWLATIPSDVLREARRFDRQGYRLVRLFSVGGEAALRLARDGNDALCLILAHAESFLDAALPLSTTGASELLALSHCELLEKFGFPASDESVEILRRLVFGGLHRSPKPFLLMLRHAMNDAEALRVLTTHTSIDERSLMTLLLTMNAMELME